MAEEEKTKLELLQEQIAAKRKERDAEEDEQHATDLEAKIALEGEHGDLSAVRVRFRPGFPTRAFLRAPTEGEYKRYFDSVAKAVEKKNALTKAQDIRRAQEQLVRACWVYPTTSEERASMLKEFPGLSSSLGLLAEKLAGGKEEDEGKD